MTALTEAQVQAACAEYNCVPDQLIPDEELANLRQAAVVFQQVVNGVATAKTYRDLVQLNHTMAQLDKLL